MFYTTGQRSKLQRIIYGILPVLAVVVIILLYALIQRRLPVILPDGRQLWERFAKTFSNPIKDVNLIGHVWASLRRVMIALVFSWTLGILFGIMMAHSRVFKALIGSILEVFRPIPPIAWIPIIVMWFGIGEFSKILLVFIGSFFPLVLNTEAGIRMVEKEYINVGRTFGANAVQQLFEIAVPTALPSIFAGVRTSVSFAWSVVLAAEMMGSVLGIGSLVTRGWENGDMALVFVAIICIGLIGAVLAFVVSKLERWLCPWNK